MTAGLRWDRRLCAESLDVRWDEITDIKGAYLSDWRFMGPSDVRLIRRNLSTTWSCTKTIAVLVAHPPNLHPGDRGFQLDATSF